MFRLSEATELFLAANDQNMVFLSAEVLDSARSASLLVLAVRVSSISSDGFRGIL